MKLYHGTKKEYLDSIFKQGLKRRANGGDSVYIYTCKTPEEAKRWGDVVVEIDAENLNLRHFYEENPVWQILIKGDVDKNRLKKFNN
jgi:RNA:NAD 2'-phosphotransferase (TPT1/KptA family)